MPIRLPSPQLLELAGPDAIAFAQAQFSSDVAALPLAHWHWSAWLSAQGRVRALFRLLHVGPGRLVAWSHATSAAVLRTALAPFVLRARVTLREIGDESAWGWFDHDAAAAAFGRAPEGTALVEHGGSIALRAGARRWLSVGPAVDGASPIAADVERWRAADIAEGIVELSDAQADRFLPPWIGLPQLGATSTTKGCYPGQEIVARLHFKGGNKRWPYRVAIAGAPLERGTELRAGSTGETGELVACAADTEGSAVGLAVLPDIADGTALQAPAAPEAAIRVVCAIARPSA
jgi:folate-binding protein YgfZ